ncbi:hypothetical protein KQX54_020899 [Cotesia glomerata]|uniref:Ig-like domain-containing protein n=1 Tax=Cotesia glomerata TaxID=32391 RepID=A0AAV7J6I1_COTGL|nr:hypothetical protein KQX54_020899 [Cotesia glomerata]
MLVQVQHVVPRGCKTVPILTAMIGEWIYTKRSLQSINLFVNRFPVYTLFVIVIRRYNYDKRLNKAQHWIETKYFDKRAHFFTASEPATLNIKQVEEKDDGEYLCRVDFVASPTRNSKIHLTVVIPPHKPNIIDEHGKTVSAIAGTYREGGDMRLTCLVSGGRPSPTVRWWKGEMLLESKDEPGEFPALRRNTLVVTSLTRADLHAIFTCQASNNNISQPVSASIAIEMYREYLFLFTPE